MGLEGAGAMSAKWSITVAWEPLDSGPPEERACFAEIGIKAGDLWLTEGHDAIANRLRKAPLLSAYPLAEWLAWNWWRLRWEPRSDAADWAFAHRLTTIGGGYIWPNITIFSDGQRTALIAKPTDERPQTPFRYITDHAVVVPAAEFEAGVDDFIDQVLERPDSQSLEDTNLQKVWQSVLTERRTPELARARKLEALLGQEPDEANPEALARLIADASRLGMAGVEEIAADHKPGSAVLTADALDVIAQEKGFDASPFDALRLKSGSGIPRIGEVAAWKLGSEAAKALRVQEGLDGQPISNKRLAEMAGTRDAVLSDRSRAGERISFALDDSPQHSRVVLRSKWESGRRFELARLIGDRVVASGGGRLLPATRAYTYRQKMQRSFAAEFLSPFEAVDEMLDGDYSTENQQEVADYFDVSELTIRTLLVNHHRIAREDFEFEAMAA
jgi:hypothetical protein